MEFDQKHVALLLWLGFLSDVSMSLILDIKASKMSNDE
jgi:hypothetical protein